MDCRFHVSPPVINLDLDTFSSSTATQQPRGRARSIIGAMSQHSDNTDGESTQPFSTPGSKEIRDNLTDRPDSPDDHRLPATCDSSDDETHFRIDRTLLEVDIVWEDSNGQIQHTRKVRMDMYVNTLEKQAFFTLHCILYCRGSQPDTKLYLFIHPEHVKSIESTNNFPSLQTIKSREVIPLRFSMLKPPRLVVPKFPVRPKGQSVDLKTTMEALASVQDFTIFFNFFSLTVEFREQLRSLPSVIHHLKTAKGRDSLDDIYHGAGGEVFGAHSPSPGPSNTLIKDTVELASPPAYIPKVPLQSPPQIFPRSDRKRRRTSESGSSPSTTTTDKGILLITAKRITELENQVKHLKRMVEEAAARTPCRCNTEELEAIYDHVDNRVDDRVDERVEGRVDDQLAVLEIDLESKVMEGTEQIVAEKAEETVEQLWNDMQEELMGEVRRELKAQLVEELRAEIKEEVLKDIAQAIFSTTRGGSEKARIANLL